MTGSLMCLTRSWLYMLSLCLDSIMQRSTVIHSQRPICEPVADISPRKAMKLFRLAAVSSRPRIHGMKIGGMPVMPPSTDHPPIIRQLHGPRTQLLQPAPIEYAQ